MNGAPWPMTRGQFGAHLGELIRRKGLNQSELARRVGVTRDTMSKYVRGSFSPDEELLSAMAVELGVDYRALFPPAAEGVEPPLPAKPQAAPQEAAELDIQVLADRPGIARLRVNRMVSLGLVAKIVALLDEDDVADRA